jgi:hypothetical protein
MLTVWRKLHLDLDSMGNGTDTGFTNRNLDDTGLEAAHQAPSGGHSRAEVNGWEPNANGRFEGGVVTVTGGGTYTIVDNIDVAVDDDVYVEGDIRPDEDKLATAVDDDAPFVPRKADISLMNSKYAPAYIVAEEAPSQSQLNLPFEPNLSNDWNIAVQTTAPGRNPGFLTTHDYWVVQIVTCFQGLENADHDPDDIYHFWTGTDFKRASIDAGEQPMIYGQTAPPTPTHYDNVSMIFLETIRDRSAWTQIFGPPPYNEGPVVNAGDVERITVIHEVGHVFGIPGGQNHPPAGIMKDSVEDPNLEFTGSDLRQFRDVSEIGNP